MNNEENNIVTTEVEETSAPVVIDKKAARKERWQQQKAEMKQEKKDRKAAKKAKRLKKKNRYKDAPIMIKLWHKVFKKVVAVALALGIIGGGTYSFLMSEAGAPILQQVLTPIMFAAMDADCSQEDIYAVSPLDEEGDAKIQAMDKIGEDETWTICYYMVGSNLEDKNESELSDMTEYLTADKKEENEEKKYQTKVDNINKYYSDLKEQNVDLPEYLLQPTEHVDTEESSSSIDMTGCATMDIEEITSQKWSDNINIVIQAGGATKWDNAMINPNKTQRFEYKNGELKEVANLALQDSCDPDTLADFMSFCDENYPADHRILVLWDHGGGAFGYGVDDIFSSGMTIADIGKALSSNYTANPETPHFDIIGFDACLMASTEVAHSLFGYGKYLTASEETEPCFGWQHDSYLQSMTDNPSMCPAQVAESIANAYSDSYAKRVANISGNFSPFDTTFSVIDINNAENAYKAYSELNKTLLKDSINDISTLAKISTSAENSTRFGSAVYDIYNTIDLGNYMSSLSEYYPNECEKVLDYLNSAVIYSRSSGFLSDSTGLSIYFPVTLTSAQATYYFLEYVNSICQDKPTRALYFYKASGTLNSEFQEFATSQNMGQAKSINTSALKSLQNNEISIQDNSYSLNLTSEQLEATQSVQLELSKYDENSNTLTSYGTLPFAELKDNSANSKFAGKAVTLDGIPLQSEVIAETDSAISFRSKVKFNKEIRYLLYSYNRHLGEFTITGLSPTLQSEETNESIHIIDKTITSLQFGDIILPIYDEINLENNSISSSTGKAIKFSANSTISMQELQDGEYLSSLQISDIRGDKFYSQIVQHSIQDGAITNTFVNTNFTGASA